MINFDEIIDRIKAIEGIGKQYQVADLFGIDPSEITRRKKSGTLLPLVVNWGIDKKLNLDWLITGEGETYLFDKGGSERVNPIKLIGDIIEGLETVLQEEGTNLPPSKKRKLIELLYKRFEKTGETVTTEIVRDHLQLIAA